MKIRSIRIRGFRNYRDISLTLEPECTLLIGENNSGKTNVLDALYAAFRINRSVRQGAFDISDYHLATDTSMAGDEGPIILTLRFEEITVDEWPTEIVAALGEVINVSPDTGLQFLVIEVTSRAQTPDAPEQYAWAFLDANDNPHKQKNIGVLNTLQTLRPFFKLNTLRDAEREFSQRSVFFGPFVTDPAFDETLRSDLLSSLSDINDKVVAAHTAFGVLRDNLVAGNSVVQINNADAVTIEAVPSRLSDLLTNTQVSYKNRSGVALPLERHGSGTQSLAVFSLFRAYVHAKLAGRLDPLSLPVLTIEEPETHLHPCAIRALWPLLQSLQGQTVITTHSGDLLSEVPLTSIRRLSHDGANTVCYSVDESQFTPGELRLLNHQIRFTRGELLFARSWILIEGRSEVTFINAVCRAIGCELLLHGVRLVEVAQHGKPESCIRLANQLGIRWHLLVDGDTDGDKYVSSGLTELHGRNQADHITQLDSANFESYMCKNGFVDIYKPHLATEKLNTIVATEGTEEYYKQMSGALKRGVKDIAALEVADAILLDPSRCPKHFLDLMKALCS